MAEAVTFWLNNKASSGVKVAEIGRELLVSYRERFYVVEEGAARMRGSKPLHYTRSSLPTIWKKAMQGIQPPPVTVPQDEIPLPRTTTTKTVYAKKSAADQPEPATEPPRQTPVAKPKTPPKPKTKPRQASQEEAAIADRQSVVVASCPYCGQDNQLPLEKGKNGKPFFTACSRCRRDFAVRFVAVTLYQAQVAAFT